MRVAFAGKGGSGKTTLSSLFVRHLAAQGLPVVAIDADINQHLGEALGADRDPPAMGAHLTQIKDFLRGTNPRITSVAAMAKTTPPGRGSRLLRPGGDDPVHDLAIGTPCGARLMATGPFTSEDLGVACYHSKTGAAELYLNHLADAPGEYVVVDCTAGPSRSPPACSPASTSPSWSPSRPARASASGGSGRGGARFGSVPCSTSCSRRGQIYAELGINPRSARTGSPGIPGPFTYRAHNAGATGGSGVAGT
jgi:CobQ/CobB/MinD/ParA nucleotide binding domain